MLTSHFVSNRALQTAYWTLGDDQAQKLPLILVHGFTGSKLDFCDQMAWFGHDRRVIAYDQRGHGESSNAVPYDFNSLVDDFFGFIDALAIPKAHVLGHSLGGMVVMRAALAQPQRFASMILMDTAPGPLGLFPEKTQRQLNDIVSEHGCHALLEGMKMARQPAHVRRAIKLLGDEEHWRRISVKLRQMDPKAFVDLAALLHEHPTIMASLADLEMQTTVIVGAKDKPFLKPSKEMTATLAKATLVKISRAGHSPQYENPQAWQEAVDTHLASLAV